jgi:hypothetical protein
MTTVDTGTLFIAAHEQANMIGANYGHTCKIKHRALEIDFFKLSFHNIILNPVLRERKRQTRTVNCTVHIVYSSNK